MKFLKVMGISFLLFALIGAFLVGMSYAGNTLNIGQVLIVAATFLFAVIFGMVWSWIE